MKLTIEERKARLERSPLYRQRHMDYVLTHQDACLAAIWYLAADFRPRLDK